MTAVLKQVQEWQYFLMSIQLIVRINDAQVLNNERVDQKINVTLHF